MDAVYGVCEHLTRANRENLLRWVSAHTDDGGRSLGVRQSVCLKQVLTRRAVRQLVWCTEEPRSRVPKPSTRCVGVHACLTLLSMVYDMTALTMAAIHARVHALTRENVIAYTWRWRWAWLGLAPAILLLRKTRAQKLVSSEI